MSRVVVSAVLFLAMSLSGLQSSPSLAASVSGVQSFIHIETSTPVYDVSWRYGQVNAGPGGVYGANVGAPRNAWYIEEQRYGDVDVIDGTLRSQPQLISEGLRIFHYGLSREAANGSFPGSIWPFHGTAMFLSQAGPALIVLNASSYAARFAGELRWQIARMRRAAHYMVRSVGGAPHLDDPTKNHRYYEAAIALGAVGVLAHDRTLTGWSTRYAWHGIAMERPGGVMPEDAGHDSGYQALGMISATRYLTLVATGSLYHALYEALAKGEAWELSRVRPDGSINQSGDTRTRGCKERGPNGQCKEIFYAPIYGALARWAAITGNARYAQAAEQVWHRSGYGR